MLLNACYAFRSGVERSAKENMTALECTQIYSNKIKDIKDGHKPTWAMDGYGGYGKSWEIWILDPVSGRLALPHPGLR